MQIREVPREMWPSAKKVHRVNQFAWQAGRQSIAWAKAKEESEIWGKDLVALNKRNKNLSPKVLALWELTEAQLIGNQIAALSVCTPLPLRSD